ncbi:MAG: repressor LexA [Candidatus Buchananbacteria bacterium RBG_13_36_9]|uniref:LexA repressor n=1 Tax=Candidatus Buchananbacteria bacterium RBG_13_36_9 TaxID=1797530 RepID=A0A1G1XPQ1_9BACT|nr:MAG: repressor LexA [Candidatus Buchananbacteria bacterium RBG_13_36_9]
MSLTKRQKEIIDYINAFTDEYGYSPSYREIGDHFGLSSTATVAEHIQNLQENGYLKTDPNEARSIEIIANEKASAIFLALAGLITAGEPIEAVEQKEQIAIPADLVKDETRAFVLKVKGQSMIEEGIFDGDYVIVEKNPHPRNGQVVVALLDNTYATLKKFYKESNRIRLQPANSSMKPIFAKNVLVQGIVRAVIRKYSYA